MTSLAVLIACSGIAQTKASDFALTEEDFFAPMPTVLSASRLVQPLSEAPVAMTVIDRQMIEASSATDIPQLLRLVPGFQISYTEGIDAISTYHGYADNWPRRMQVLVDGRSVYDPGLNGVIWSALPLTMGQIERIEVVRGPNAAAYGSNAFLGTINIITRSPEASDSLVVRAMGGDDSFEGEISHAGRADQFAYRLNASYVNSEGFDGKADDSKSRILNFQGVYRPTLKDNLTFSTGLRETPFDSEAFRIPREREYRTHYQQLVWDHVFSTDEDFRFQLYHNAFKSPDDIRFTDPGLGPVRIDYTLSTHRYDVELQHRFSPAEDWRLSWGGGLRWDRVEGGVVDAKGNLDRDQVRIFANSEWRPRSDVVVNLGVMGEDYSDVGDYFSPRIGLNWHVVDHHTLRFSAARAYRMPTFVERYGKVEIDLPDGHPLPDQLVFLGTEGNDAEEVHSYEVGYLFEAPAINGTFDLRLFHNEVRPILNDAKDESIDQNPGYGSPRRVIEAGALRLTGLEFQAQLRPFEGNLIHLAYAYVKADGSQITDTDADGNPVPQRKGDNPEEVEDYVPEHTLTAMVAQEFADDWLLSGTFSYVSDTEWLGDGDAIDGHGRVDAKLAKRFRSQDGDIEFSLGVHNLFDDPYWEFIESNADTGVNGNLSERRIYGQVKFILR